MEPPNMKPTIPPFLFPPAPEPQSTHFPVPSFFFSPNLSAPFPTNSFFQNFAIFRNYTIGCGQVPEYIHPYLIRLSLSSLSLSYPSRCAEPERIYQVFTPELTIAASSEFAPDTPRSHKITSFSDLSVTVTTWFALPGTNPSYLQFYLVRGSPYITYFVPPDTNFFITTFHTVTSFSSNSSNTKYTIKLDNNQKWLIYADSPINLAHRWSEFSSTDSFSGVIRIAVVPDSDSENELLLDRFSSCYPVSGKAFFPNPNSIVYKWDKRGPGRLLMLAHPLHLKLLSTPSVLNSFRYRSIDGDLVGVVGDSWQLTVQPVPVTWHSINGVDIEAFPDIFAAVSKDIRRLDIFLEISSEDLSYFFGKLITRAARLALIAEEVGYLKKIPRVIKLLKEKIEPWLDGSFPYNGFLYDSKWGGIVTKKYDLGFAHYSDHHYQLGYFLYAIAVIVKFDPAWGRKFRPQAYALMADFMNLGSDSCCHYPRLRCFDMYKLHSWADGLEESEHGRHQESPSQAVGAYYAAALMGLAYEDDALVSLGSTLAAFEIEAAKTWWYVREGKGMYDDGGLSAENPVVGVWANKRARDGLSPCYDKERRVGALVHPLLPITQVLFSDADFARVLVEWSFPPMRGKEVVEGWKQFVYALQGIYDKEGALEQIRGLVEGCTSSNGNSMSNLLWWIHSRHAHVKDEEGEKLASLDFNVSLE